MPSPPEVWIFARWPEPGQVKTRLCPPLTSEQAVRLATAFLRDWVHRLRPVTALNWGFAFTPLESEAQFEKSFPEIPLWPQGAGDLGERMHRVVAERIERGAAAVLLAGADCPLYPAETLLEAVTQLTQGQADVVITPAPDGGYSMIGMKRSHPLLFTDIPWSTRDVLKRTLERIYSLHLSVHLTDPVADCDVPQDLLDLRDAYRRHPEAFMKCAPHTASLLAELDGTL